MPVNQNYIHHNQSFTQGTTASVLIMLFNKESAKKVDVSPGTSCSSSAERRQLAGEEEYPSGVRLVIVVVALVLSIFLVFLTSLYQKRTL